MKELTIVLVLTAVLVISGCSQPVNTSESRGVTINSFIASPTGVLSGETVIFDVEIENIGGTTARNVQVDLYGVEGQWRDITGNLIDSTLTKWGGLTLDPPFPPRNIPGDLRITQWQIVTPDIPQGTSPTLPIEARVTYDYNTSGHLGVALISQDEWRRRQLNGGDVSDASEMVNSAGPLKLTIDPRFQKPIIVDTSSNEQFETYPFRIQIDNVGDGYPITPEDDAIIRGAGGRLQGTIDIFGAGVEFDECLGVTGGTHIDLDDADVLVRLREVGRGSVPIACNVKIDMTKWNNRPDDTMQFIFNIRYRYYVAATANVMVTGQ
jgi:hypothetical protein